MLLQFTPQFSTVVHSSAFYDLTSDHNKFDFLTEDEFTTNEAQHKQLKAPHLFQVHV